MLVIFVLRTESHTKIQGLSEFFCQSHSIQMKLCLTQIHIKTTHVPALIILY